jgi:hypothetical protein
MNVLYCKQIENNVSAQGNGVDEGSDASGRRRDGAVVINGGGGVGGDGGGDNRRRSEMSAKCDIIPKLNRTTWRK